MHQRNEKTRVGLHSGSSFLDCTTIFLHDKRCTVFTFSTFIYLRMNIIVAPPPLLFFVGSMPAIAFWFVFYCGFISRDPSCVYEGYPENSGPARAIMCHVPHRSALNANSDKGNALPVSLFSLCCQTPLRVNAAFMCPISARPPSTPPHDQPGW